MHLFKAVEILRRARREGGEQQCQKLKENPLYRRMEQEDILLFHWGKVIKTCPLFQDSLNKKTLTRPTPKVLMLNTYPFSDQHALFTKFRSDLLSFLSPGSRVFKSGLGMNRFNIAQTFFREGDTVCQRYIMAPLVVFYEVLLSILCVVLLVGALFVHFFVLFGFRFPVLWLFNFTVSGAGIHGREVLPPGENGYTKLFRGGEDIDLADLEAELMTRNLQSSIAPRGGNIIAISYKHYANKGKTLGDDNRICRTDLQTIARLIKESAPCNLRFWIDAKLPQTDDASFERWINRGVRPYGRYITLICPSAIEYAPTSFWLANEYHFAAAGKGVMFLEDDKFFFELRYGYNLDLYRRFLQLIIGTEGSPMQVRTEDKGKVIHWALCCLGASHPSSTGGMLSPNIDNLTMVEEISQQSVLVNRITEVIEKFGPQELPVVQGRSWNVANPLLMGDAPHQQFDLSIWLGLCLDGFPTTIYFVHGSLFAAVHYPTITVLEVTLDKPHFAPGKIQVTRKVLRKVDRRVLLNCKLVTLPWRCEWS